MKKYQIKTDTIQEDGRFSIHGLSGQDIIDLYLDRVDIDPVTVRTFEDEAEARKYFEANKNELASSQDKGEYANFTIAFLCAEEFDEDDEPAGDYEELEYFAHPIKAKVVFEGGESRYNPEKAADYMLVKLTDGTELYAEAEPVEGDEWANFDTLKAEILKQAAEAGISPDRLYFIGD